MMSENENGFDSDSLQPIQPTPEPKKVRNWGKPVAVVALVFGILSLVIGVFALIPLFGLYFAIITGILAIVAIGFGIPGVIGSASKNVAITALIFGGLMLTWAIVRYFWMVGAVLAL